MIFFKHPLVTSFLDDDETYLDSLREVFIHTERHCHFFSEVEDFKKFILQDQKNKKKFEGLYNNLLRNFDITTFTQELLFFLKIHPQLLSVIVIDYHLKNNETGLEVLQSLEDQTYFKILCTGFADEQIAVEAFHKGLINYYYKKTNKITDLIAQVNVGVDMFFSRISLAIKAHLQAEEVESALLDPEFQMLFENFLQSHNIKAFYLIDKYGSFLCLDNKNNYHSILVMPKDSVSSQIEILEELGKNKEANEVLNSNKLLYINDALKTNFEDMIFECSNLFQNKNFLVSHVSANLFDIRT